jgi:hypothetical protein
MVELTAREHFICHLLLPKMTSGSAYHKMLYAYIIMSGRRVYNSNKYAFYRREYAEANSILRSGPGNGMFGVDRSGEKNTFFGKSHSDETKRKISEKKKGQGKGIKRPPFTEEHRKNIGVSQRNRAHKYVFVHPDHGIFEGSTGDMNRAYGIMKSELYLLAVGRYKTYKKWRCVSDIVRVGPEI